MNIKLGIKIVSGTVLITVGVATLVGRLRKKRKAKIVTERGVNEKLYKNFEAFKSECNKSSEAAAKAIKLMDELMKQLDEKMGIDPEDIDAEIIEVIPFA